MDNNLRRLEKELRAFVKRTKDFKYNQALLMAFLITGMLLSFSAIAEQTTTNTTNTTTETLTQEIEGVKKSIDTSISTIQKDFKTFKAENNKLLKTSKLELIKLMEQGDQVVKSPWSSWQYGMNYFYGDWHGTYKGMGDKKQKYPYEGIFQRGEWWERNVTAAGNGYELLSRDSNPYSASTTRRGDSQNQIYGLMARDLIGEAVKELELGAGVRPKAVTRKPVPVSAPAAPSGSGPALPNVNIPRFNPAAPKILVPQPGTAPIFNIELGAFCNNMTGCGLDGNAGYAFVGDSGRKIGIASSFNSDTNTNSLPDNPALRYSWNFSDNPSSRSKGQYRLLKVHFDAVADAKVDITKPLTIDSINPLSTTEKSSETTANRGFNTQAFLVGGSRVATLDNGNNGSYIKNSSILNLKGPLVIGLEMQYDALGDSTDRLLKNIGEITDSSEKDEATIGGIGKGQSISLDLGLYDWSGATPVNLSTAPTEFYRNNAGYFGAKIGLILTLEDDTSASASKKYVFENDGKIEFNGDKSIGIQVFSPVKNTLPKVSITNNDTITVAGAESYGIKISSAVDTANSSVENKGTINVGGIKERTNDDGLSAGIAVLEDSTMNGTTFNQIQAGNMVKNTGTGKIYVSGQGNSGMFLKTAFGDTFTNESGGLIEVKGGTKNIGMRIDTGTVATPSPAVIQSGINSGTIKIIGGTSNIGMFSNGATAAVTNNNEIEISGDSTVQSNAGIMSNNSGAFTNNGTIKVSGGKNNLGMYVGPGLTGTSTASSKILVTGGEENTGVANEGGTYNLAGSTLEVSGLNSIGIYSNKKGTANPTTTVTGTMKSSNSAVAMFAENSTMDLSNLNVEVGSTGLLFYNYTKSGSNYNPTGSFKIGTGVNANIKKDGVAFYNVGPIGSEKNFLDMLVKNGGDLNLNMDAGSRLFVFDQPGLVVNLSGIPAQPVGGTIPLNNNSGQVALVTGTGYKFYTVNKATLNIDQQVNLNDAADKYHSLDFISSNVNINNLMTNNGAALPNGLQYAVAQGNAGTAVGDLVVTNNSNVELTGQPNLTGIVTDFGTIVNSAGATVKNTGDNGIGLLGINSSVVTNNGTITVGNGGAAIYGINSLPSGSVGDINLTNNGTITSEGTTAASYGVVAKNRAAGKTSTVTLGTNSNIDFSSNPGGVGAYVEKTTLNNSGGTIKLGTNGVGIQAIDSALNLTGGKITGSATGAKGIYSNTAITNTGTEVDLQGDNSISVFSTVSVNNSTTTKIGNSANNQNPSIAIYAPIVENNGTVDAGVNSIGIYSGGTSVNLRPSSTLNTGTGGTGVYKDSGTVTLHSGATLNVAPNNTIGIFGANGATIDNYQSNVNIGDSAIGFAVDGGTFNSFAGMTQNLATDVIYAYARNNGTINNKTAITTTGNANVLLYGDESKIINDAVLDLRTGIGNVGMLTVKTNNPLLTNAVNNSDILVGKSDRVENLYSIGMASTTGAKSENNGTITVTGDRGIGMYGTGLGTEIKNNIGKKIILDASGATSTSPIKQMVGMYVEDGAKGYNYGDIETRGSYVGNNNVSGLIGVAVVGNNQNKSTFENHGNITIDADSGYGMYVFNGIIKNYGTITVNGSGTRGVYFKNAETTEGTALTTQNVATELNNGTPAGTVIANGSATAYEQVTYDPTKTAGGITLKKGADGLVHAYDINGNILDPHLVNTIPSIPYMAFSNIGVYIDTLGRTSPISGTGYNPTGKIDVIVGTEAAEATNKKVIKIGSNIMKPFVDAHMNANGGSLSFYSGSLTWQATYDENDVSVTMSKIPYTEYATDKNSERNLYNFTDGLEQRYDMNALDSREKALFNKLNTIGDNEDILLSQAFDEMMGHQYGNVQQRVYNTVNALNKEINYLQKDWRNPSKQSNKIKTFGMRDEYKTDTAGIIDYTSNAYGVAYVHEDESIKLGNSSGWYAGAVHNRFKLKDIGGSKENQTLLKAGIFKTISPAADHNGALQWTISGDVFAGINEMKRRYLVVDEIFNANADYNTYGVGIKNELGYNVRLSERTHLRPYGSLRMEYGRFSSIKEDSGEVRLEVEGNDYYSIKPEVGLEFKYIQPMAVKTNLTVGLTAAYETELGKVNDVKNKARVRDTTADWFGIRGEKEDRRGSGKFDLNIGVDNTRFGVTVNAGYDTRGENVRGGIGFRAIY